MTNDAGLGPTVTANTTAVLQLAEANAQLVAQVTALSEAVRELSESRTEMLGTISALLVRVNELETQLRAERSEVADDPVPPIEPGDRFDLDGYWQQVSENYAALSVPIAVYEDLVRRIVEHPRLRPVSLATLGGGGHHESGVEVALRHDIDTDPQTAVALARVLARHGVAGSFFFLHSAAYYSRRTEDGSVERNVQGLAEWVTDLIVAGAEIGLHNDALGVMLEHGDPPMQTLAAELAFLRSLGAQVRGTVAHNSAPVHGAENSEVFVGLAGPDAGHRGVVDDRVSAALGTVDPAALDLSYEGSFARPRSTPDPDAIAAYLGDRETMSIRNEDWMRRHLVDNPLTDWALDAQAWHLGGELWVLAGGRGPDALWRWGIDPAALVEEIAAMPDGSRVTFVLHPAYLRG